jgi:(p)ppGpp synthase/HD superfamily hydrolase
VEPGIILSDTFDRAVSLARRWHAEDVRKGTDVPYLAHLLAVCSLVLEAGGDENQAIAALLHDSLEDAPDMDACEARRCLIGMDFRPEVLAIVEACTDATPDEKRTMTWRDRKERFLTRLGGVPGNGFPESCLLVAAADKLHNARAVLYGVRREGPGFLDRFNAPPEGTRWYYRRLGEIFTRAFDPEEATGRLAQELARLVAAIEEEL